jgi:hypothetical protein
VPLPTRSVCLALQVRMYDFGRADFSPETGHFTQMVWRSSQRMGCGFVSNCPELYPHLLVCHYDPFGEVLVVGRPCKRLP